MPREKVRGALDKKGFVSREGTPALLSLGQGDLRAEEYLGSDWDRQPPAGPSGAAAAQPATGCQGLNFSFPMGLSDAEGERAIGVVLDLSEEFVGNLYDPQLGTTVRRSDHERISMSWRQSHSFHFGVAGTPSLGSALPTEPPQVSYTWGKIKILLVVAAVLLVGILIFRTCFSRWMEAALDAPSPVASPAGGEPVPGIEVHSP
jgi:hypothetical protein